MQQEPAIVGKDLGLVPVPGRMPGPDPRIAGRTLQVRQVRLGQGAQLEGGTVQQVGENETRHTFTRSDFGSYIGFSEASACTRMPATSIS